MFCILHLSLSLSLCDNVDNNSGLVQYYDFAVNEQCFQYEECLRYYKVFTNQNKAVFGVEYEGNIAVFCKTANQNKLSFQKKRLGLRVWRIG